MEWTDKKRHILRRLDDLERERKSWESEWRDLANHFLPVRARFLNAGDRTNDGSRRNKLEDDIGILARRTLAAGMLTGLTSPARPWFSLAPLSADLAQSRAVKAWVHYIYEQMVNVFNRSNFYDQMHLLYDELATFGTAVMIVEDDPASTIRCRTLTVGEYCLDVGANGRVDALWRRVRMTPRQIVEAWPDSAPERIKVMADKDNNEWQTVIQSVEINKNYVKGSLNKKNRRYLSTYMVESGELLEEGGFYEFVALCPRWNTTASDIYGTSPAMDALGDCRQLQAITRDGRIALEMEVRPPLQTAGLSYPVDLSPGAINPVSTLAQGQFGITPLYQVRANFAALSAEKSALKQQIREMFFNDLFLMITQANRTMTATEVAERNAEKMLLLGPVLDRLRSELFQPLIERVFGIMSRNGDIPPAPPEMQGQEIKIEFISILALAQKQAGLAAINNTLTFVATAAQMTQSLDPFDKINIDEAINEVAEMNGVPPALIRSDEEVAQARGQRAEQMQQAKQMQQAEQGVALAAEGAKAAGSLPPEMLAALGGVQ